MNAHMREIQDTVRQRPLMPERAEMCPVCGSDGNLESAMIRSKLGMMGYYAGLIYHCPSCGTAWPLCGNEEKVPVEDWVEFDEFYDGLE